MQAEGDCTQRIGRSYKGKTRAMIVDFPLRVDSSLLNN